MLTLELPDGTVMDFESTEALEHALRRIREGKPIVVRDEHDGSVELLWAPEDERRHQPTWHTVYDPESGEIDWKKSDPAYPEHAVHYLIRGRERRRALEAEERRAGEEDE